MRFNGAWRNRNKDKVKASNVRAHERARKLLAELRTKAAKVDAFKGGWNKQIDERKIVGELVAPYRDAGLKPDWEAIAAGYHRRTGKTRTKDSLRKLHKRA